MTESSWIRRVCRTAAIACLSLLSLAGFAVQSPAVESRQLESREGLVRLMADPEESSFRIPPPIEYLVPPKDLAGAKASVTINYLPAGPGEFEDTCIAWPEQPKAAFTYAANIWGSLLQSSVPITINACWSSNMESGVLGHAGATNFFRNFSGAPLTNTYYASALANALAGRDMDSSQPDIYAAFNSAFSWYVGTDGNTPTTQHDFASVVLHEIGHGLGFSGSMNIVNGQASYGGNGSAISYDRFTENQAGQSLVNTSIFPNPSAVLAAQLTSGGVYFKGTVTNAANGGTRAPLYAPSTWSSGLSFSHLAESYNNTPNALMTFSIARGESLHNPGPVTLGILRDQGWTQVSAAQYTLTVSKLGSGSGTVTSSPSGVSCGTACSASFSNGATVTLTAAANSGSKFTGWGGACSGTGICSVTMSAATTVTATFGIAATLTVTKAGTGGGVVSSTPAGISCGTTCSASFSTGSAVTLAATPDSGSLFAGWGGACSGTGACTVTIGSTNAVTATFNVNGGIVTIAKSGTGAGTVVSTPAGVSCGATCAVPFATGTSVSLTAIPAPGSSFTGWTGACTGTTVCTLVVTGNATVTAAFAAQTAALTANSGALDFGGQSISTTAPAQAITLTNRTTATVSIASVVSSSSSYSLSHNCGTLAVNASCTISVAFTPQAQGPLSALVTITSSQGTSVVSLAGSGERSLVSHYYRSILGRTADTAGKAYWESEATRVAALGANVNETWFAMAMSFFNSAEYLAFNRSNADYVRDLYITFFNRAPDTVGSTYWSGQLAAGLPREVLLVTFMFSTEFTTFTKGIFGTQTVRAEVDAVVDLYRGLLSRLPDSAGFNYWVNQFQAAQCSGATAVFAQVEAMSGAYAESAEYIARGRTSSQFVGDMYNSFLRRGGDLAGVQFWIGQVDTGARTRSKVRQDFIATPEFSAKVTAIINQGCRFQ